MAWSVFLSSRAAHRPTGESSIASFSHHPCAFCALFPRLREVLPYFLWLWDVWWWREECLSNGQILYFWRETNIAFYSLTPLVFLSRNHLDSEGSHKHHLGLLNLRFLIVYECTLGSQTGHEAVFQFLFRCCPIIHVSARTQVLEWYLSSLWMAFFIWFTSKWTHFSYRRVTLGGWWLWGNQDTRMPCRVSVFHEEYKNALD